jgi:Tol biopolymer transport system component
MKKSALYLFAIFLLMVVGCTAVVEESTPSTPPTEEPEAVLAEESEAEESEAGGNAAVYRINADGSDLSQLTDHTTDTLVFGWSPDGQQLALTASPAGILDIYVMNADGTGLRPLTQNQTVSTSPVWSPDGERIAFSARNLADYGDQGIYVINADGGGLTRLTEAVMEPIWLSWSPDGTRLLFSAFEETTYDQYATDVYVINIDGGDVRNLTQHLAEDEGPAWSPDGERIVFSSNRDGNWDLYVMNADGSAPVRVAQTPGDDGYASWSPDGRQILFKSNRVEGHHQDAFDVFVVNADGSELRNLTGHPASDDWPQWSPDGSRIAFTSERENNEEIYVMNADGSEPVRLTATDGRNWPVYWSPDGQQLVFNHTRPEGGAKLPDDETEALVTDAAEPTPTAVPTPTNPPLTAVPMATNTPATEPSPSNQSNGRSNNPVISDDGRFVVFLSTGKLTENALSGGRLVVFMRDRETQTTTLVSVTQDGRAPFDDVYGVSLSADGRTVAYYSFDGQITADDPDTCTEGDLTAPCEDLFIYDRQTEVSERIRVGRSPGLGKDYTVALSADGRYVAYDNLQVFDRQTGQAISIFSQPLNGHSFAPAFAHNGDLAFVSSAGNLVPGDSNETYDVFVWQAETGQITRVSVASDGAEGDDVSGAMPFHEGVGEAMAISADGRFVAFASLATTLTPDAVNQCDDYRGFTRTCYNLYLHDRDTGQTRLVVNGDGDSMHPALSADGRFLAFASLATNLVEGVTPCPSTAIVNCGQIFLLDVETGAFSLISRTMAGGAAGAGSWGADISADGRFITFVSEAADLVPGDTNNVSDIFLYDRETGRMERVSVANGG